jgi:catabolite regulation protein CreA
MGGSIAGLSIFLGNEPLHADSRLVGDVPTSGFVFKDTLKITAFNDPKVEGITLYLADFDRPAIEKLNNIFDDPSSSSLTCAKTGPITFKNIDRSQQGEEVFEESKNLIFKQIRVKRIFDPSSNTLVYTSFSTRFNKGGDDNKSRFKSSLCAVSLYDPSVQITKQDAGK